HAHIALAVEHEQDFFRGCVPVLGVGLSRKDVHEPKALLAARGEVVVGNPLDTTPLVGHGLNVLCLGAYALQHWSLHAGSKVNSRSSGARHLGRGRSKSIPPGRKFSAFYHRLQFYRRLQWRGSCKTSSSNSRELSKTPRRLGHLRQQRKLG